MEIKVREVKPIESKGVQELEEELLNKHEEQIQVQSVSMDHQRTPEPTPEPEPAPELESELQQEPQPEPQQPSVELQEEDVLSYISKRYNKQINSFDELVAERSDEQLPEDVSAYLKYRKETGRGFEDFLKLKEDFDTMDPDSILRSYLKTTQVGLDDEDIDVMMEDYSYNEDLDDDSTIKKAKLAKKKMIAEAKQYFNTQKEKYKMPLESRTADISQEEKEELQAYKQYISQAKTMEQEAERKREWFSKKTDEVFNNEFKGFEFKLNDQVLRFAPGDAVELKKAQLTPTNFINKYLDDNGMIKDAVGYHRALAVAMNPERFAKFFYEQGMSAATEDVNRKIKNINMSERQAPQSSVKDGFQVKSVNPDSGKGLKIRSIKRI
ncbi:MAG: hypothetical protein EBR30_12285 [Cytophagia bacterium]|nr:hypothetical protein [Cytophagia bacterium]